MTSPEPNSVQLDAPAPDFSARSTHGPLRLSDYRGRWLVFFSHPADFTPVCTSEFIAFERAADRFRARGAELLGLSIDSLYAHLAWVKDIEARFGETISFPIIEDISMAVARAYGMISETSQTTATVRSVFFIDPDGIIRASILYPMNVGRSVEEVFRVLCALQISDAQSLSTPEGWTEGEPLVLPPPESVAEAQTRTAEADGSWYLTRTKGAS